MSEVSLFFFFFLFSNMIIEETLMKPSSRGKKAATSIDFIGKSYGRKEGTSSPLWMEH